MVSSLGVSRHDALDGDGREQMMAGIRVLELGQVLSAPFAGAILGDLGAEVLKIERVEGGDDARRMGPDFRHGDALTFHMVNRNKQSVALDLKSPAGMAAFESLAATADILIHNLRPGAAEALGIGGGAMIARHPRLIYCAISAFGHKGPMASKPGYEPLIQAYSGLSSCNGGPDDPPMRLGVAVCDQGTGMWIVIGALAALQRRAATGRGCVVTGSLLETALVWAAQRGDMWVNEGRLPEKHRSGHPALVPYEAFDASDGPFVICCGNDRLFAKLAGALGKPEWAEDPRFATNRARLSHKGVLVVLMGEILRLVPRAEWIARLEAAGVPAAPINTLPEALAEPQARALGILQDVPGEDYRLTGSPLSFDGVRPAIRNAAPRLGDWTERVLG
jgi:crotonobetainyl-CoA:carnitine CoA-transferase CaiB-like acyl-CoA transferase